MPVPLTDIEARRMPTTIQGGKTIGGINPIERDALCEALRIAVEQGAHDPNCNLDIVACDCWLAAVRELVNLGEKP